MFLALALYYRLLWEQGEMGQDIRAESVVAVVYPVCWIIPTSIHQIIWTYYSRRLRTAEKQRIQCNLLTLLKYKQVHLSNTT